MSTDSDDPRPDDVPLRWASCPVGFDVDKLRDEVGAAYERIARETLEWTLREMQGEGGGYYSTQDADSEGEEGKFYVWTRDEIGELLNEDAEPFCDTYDVTSGGNWEGNNILHLVEHQKLDAAQIEARV